LRSGYHQIGLREEDKEKTAFWGIDKDGKDWLYQWKFLPFGLKNVLESHGPSILGLRVCEVLSLEEKTVLNDYATTT
jgi:hypothetical protein